MKITITDDKKEKDQSFEATTDFNYIWDNSGYGGDMSMTVFGSTEQEARERLKEELYRFQSEFVKALSKLFPPDPKIIK